MFLPRAKVFQRYDLTTGARELVAPAEGRIQPRPEWDTGGRSQPQPTVLPVGRVTAFCMGHASAGPFIMGIENGPPGVYDLETLRPVSLPGQRALTGGWYWAGATSRLLGNSGTDGGMPNGAAAVSLKPGGVEVHSQHVPSSYVVPGPDDALVFAGSYGIVTPKTEPAAGVAERAVYKHVPGKALYLPACHGPYYLAVDRPDLAADPARPPAPTPKPLGTTVRVYRVRDAQPIATLADVPVGRTAGAGAFGPRFEVKLEDHVHLIPRAKLVVALTDGRDALRLIPFDPAAALDKTGRPYLVFTSVPPPTFTPGRPLAYQAEVLAKSRPVVFKLQGGPPGMGVSSDGRVTWTPPARVVDKGYSPILFATDAAGQEAFQLIELTNGGP